jgi:hypothetical protein
MNLDLFWKQVFSNYIVMLNVVMLNVIILSVVMLSVWRPKNVTLHCNK